MDHDDFANIEWQNSHGSPQITSPRSEDGTEASDVERHSGGEQAGRMADEMDLAGVGEGILECTVGSPIKENDGTKDAFVSYLVTTHVWLPTQAPQDRSILTMSRLHFPLSKSPQHQYGDGSQISYSYTTHFSENILHAPSPPYQTSTKWSMFAATGLAPTSHSAAPTPSTAS